MARKGKWLGPEEYKALVEANKAKTRSVDQNGYVSIRRPWPSNGWVKEHRYVMELEIGRRLFPNETVHHRNGVRDDNRLENLELWASHHPPGQRVEDLVEWAKDILSLYGESN
jgi:hypothetical protein